MSTEVTREHSEFVRGGFEDEYVLSFRDLIAILRKRVWLILLIALLIAGGAFGLTMMQTPMYQASTKILVGQEPGALGTPQGNVWTPDLINQLTKTLVEGARSRPLAEDAIGQLGWEMSPDAFLGNVTAEQVASTQFINVSYQDTSPERTQQAANAIGDAFSRWVSEINPSSVNIYATVVEEAQMPQAPVSPKPFRNGLVGLGVGLILGVGIAILLEYLEGG